MIFGVLNPRKFDINSSYNCPPHLYTAATLPWENQKVIFQQYYSYTSDYLRYRIRKHTVTSLPTKPEKCRPRKMVLLFVLLLFFGGGLTLCWSCLLVKQH